MDFVHLHGHTKYSEKDALTTIEQIIDKCKKNNMNAVAVTEHGTINSLIVNFKACKKAGIKLIIGEEFYHTLSYGDNETDDRFHLVCLAKNDIGLKNLYRMSSEAGLNAIKPKQKLFPIAEIETFKKYGEGIIASSACIGGLIPKLILNGKYNEAKERALEFNSYFEEFYLELQANEMSEQLVVNELLVKMSKETGIPLIITCDYHYIDESDREYHDILKKMIFQFTFDFSAHFQTPKEIEDYCNTYDIPLSAMSNTVKIANSCNVDPMPKDKLWLYPKFPTPKGYDSSSYLRKVAAEGLIKKHIKKNFPDMIRRIAQLEFELDVICTKGYADYFLILWDWFEECKKRGILIGPGRGSAAGAITSYALNITKIDPIKNDFLFSRFMTMERNEEPDCDSDIPTDRRAEAIKILEDKYGTENVAQIITYSQYNVKNLITDILRLCNVPFDESKAFTTKIPGLIEGDSVTFSLIEKIVNDYDWAVDKYGEKNVNKIIEINNKLQEYYNQYPQVYKAVERLGGIIVGSGAHAGGIVISGRPLNENMGIVRSAGAAVLPLTQFDMDSLHELNALKIDGLGLSAMSKIRAAMDLIGLDNDWYESEDFDDEKVYDHTRKGITYNVFQMRKPGAKRLLKEFNVKTFDGLVAVNACNRPGPLAKNKETGKAMVDYYIQNIDPSNIKSYHPDIDVILADTRGCIVYQEQCMKIAQVLAGYSDGNVDGRIRSPLCKKKVDLFPEIKNEFLYGKKSIYAKENPNDPNSKEVVVGLSTEDSPYCEGAQARGYDLKMCEEIFDEMTVFARYCFNKSHSGAYGMISFKTAWLMTYYPVEWSVACLNTYNALEDISATLSDARKLGVKILPPDINKSESNFTVEVMQDGTKAIRFGLQGIKGIGESPMQRVMECRPYTSFDDFIGKVINGYLPQINSETGKKIQNPVKKTHIVPLILSGAFDEFDENRYNIYNRYIIDIKKEKGTVAYDVTSYSRRVRLEFEKELLGLYVSEHPLETMPYTNVKELESGEFVEITGMIKSKEVKKTAGGKKYTACTFEAKDGETYRANLFGKSHKNFSDYIIKDGACVFYGSWSAEYNNVTVNKVKKLVKSNKSNDEEEIEEIAAELDYPVRDDAEELETSKDIDLF